MQAFILAAGKGTRMLPLTANCPKPLLKVAGKPLLQHQIERLHSAGVSHIIINVSYLGDMVREFVQTLQKPHLTLAVSEEPYPLETAGAIVHAAPLLNDEPFILVNADVWTDFPYARFLNLQQSLAAERGHLVFIPNPAHKNGGDYALAGDRVIPKDNGDETFTFSGISVLSPDLIMKYPNRREKFALKEVFDWAIDHNKLSGELYQGDWIDVGTPERLQVLSNRLS